MERSKSRNNRYEESIYILLIVLMVVITKAPKSAKAIEFGVWVIRIALVLYFGTIGCALIDSKYRSFFAKRLTFPTFVRGVFAAAFILCLNGIVGDKILNGMNMGINLFVFEL